MDSPVEFTKTVRPICLPSNGKIFNGQTATVIGWGSLRESKYIFFKKNYPVID